MSNRFSANTGREEITAAIKRDGYAIIERVMSEEALLRLRAGLQPHVDVTDTGTEDFWGHHTKRFGALIAKSATAREMLVDPIVLGTCDDILLEHCAAYWVNYTGIMHLGPGERAQVLHRDTNLWPISNPAPPLTVATMWAVSEFTADNGGTLVVPGSHLWDDDRKPEPEEIVATEMPPGSVLLYTGNVIHGGGANKTDKPRFGVALHYVLGWLRQEENQVLTTSMEEARELPEQIQRLMGYSLGAPALGFVDHMDPFEKLNGVQGNAPATISPQDLLEAEARMNHLTVTASGPRNRTRIDVAAE